MFAPPGARVATPPLMADSGSVAADEQMVRLLILKEQISEEQADQILTELSEAFHGFLAFPTDCTWQTREQELRSGEAVAVEIIVAGSDDGTSSEGST